MTAAKIAVSLPPDLIQEIRESATECEQSVSAWVREAAEVRLKRVALGKFLADLDAELGPVSDEALARAAALWQD